MFQFSIFPLQYFTGYVALFASQLQASINLLACILLSHTYFYQAFTLIWKFLKLIVHFQCLEALKCISKEHLSWGHSKPSTFEFKSLKFKVKSGNDLLYGCKTPFECLNSQFNCQGIIVFIWVYDFQWELHLVRDPLLLIFQHEKQFFLH